MSALSGARTNSPRLQTLSPSLASRKSRRDTGFATASKEQPSNQSFLTNQHQWQPPLPVEAHLPLVKCNAACHLRGMLFHSCALHATTTRGGTGSQRTAFHAQKRFVDERSRCGADGKARAPGTINYQAKGAICYWRQVLGMGYGACDGGIYIQRGL